MKNNIVSSYSNAFFEIAQSQDKFGVYLEDTLILKELFLSNPLYAKLLNSQFISNEEKHILLDKVFKNNIQTMTLNFLHVLVIKKGFIYFNEIIKECIKLCTYKINARDVYVYSTSLLNKDKLDKLKLAVEKKYGFRVFIHNVIDKEIIGGIKMIIDDIVIDNTIAYHINELKNEMIKLGE